MDGISSREYKRSYDHTWKTILTMERSLRTSQGDMAFGRRDIWPNKHPWAHTTYNLQPTRSAFDMGLRVSRQRPVTLGASCELGFLSANHIQYAKRDADFRTSNDPFTAPEKYLAQTTDLPPRQTWWVPDICKWELRRMIPLVGGFSPGTPFPPDYIAAPYSPRFTLIGSQDLDVDVKSRPDFCTPLHDTRLSGARHARVLMAVVVGEGQVRCVQLLELMKDVCCVQALELMKYVCCVQALELMKDVCCVQALELMKDVCCVQALELMKDVCCVQVLELMKDVCCVQVLELMKDVCCVQALELMKDVCCVQALELKKDVCCVQALELKKDVCCVQALELMKYVCCVQVLELMKYVCCVQVLELMKDVCCVQALELMKDVCCVQVLELMKDVCCVQVLELMKDVCCVQALELMKDVCCVQALELMKYVCCVQVLELMKYVCCVQVLELMKDVCCVQALELMKDVCCVQVLELMKDVMELMKDVCCVQALELMKDVCCVQVLELMKDVCCVQVLELMKDVCCVQALELMKDVMELMKDVCCVQVLELMKDVCCVQALELMKDVCCVQVLELMKDVCCVQALELMKDVCCVQALELKKYVCCEQALELMKYVCCVQALELKKYVCCEQALELMKYVCCVQALELMKYVCCVQALELMKYVCCVQALELKKDVCCVQALELMKYVCCVQALELMKDVCCVQVLELMKDVCCVQVLELMKDVCCVQVLELMKDVCCVQALELMKDVCCVQLLELMKDVCCVQVLELMKEVAEDDDDSSDISGYHSDSDSAIMMSGNSPYVSKRARHNFLTRSEWTDPAPLNIEVLRADVGEVSAGMQGRGKRQIPEKTCQPTALSVTIPTCEHLGATSSGMEPCSHVWSEQSGRHTTVTPCRIAIPIVPCLASSPRQTVQIQASHGPIKAAYGVHIGGSAMHAMRSSKFSTRMPMLLQHQLSSSSGVSSQHACSSSSDLHSKTASPDTSSTSSGHSGPYNHRQLSHKLNSAGATVAEQLARSPPTKANRVQYPAGSPDFCMWESCRTMPLVGMFSWGSLVSPAPSFQCHSIFTSITLISSQDLPVKNRPNLFTHSLISSTSSDTVACCQGCHPHSAVQTLPQSNEGELVSVRSDMANLRVELSRANSKILELQEAKRVLQERLALPAHSDAGLSGEMAQQLVHGYGSLYASARVDTLDALDNLPPLRDAHELKSKILFSVIVVILPRDYRRRTQQSCRRRGSLAKDTRACNPAPSRRFPNVHKDTSGATFALISGVDVVRSASAAPNNAQLKIRAQRNTLVVSEDIWVALKIGVFRADKGEARRVWSSARMQGWGKVEIPEKTSRPAASSGTIL
ncbi:hypothetical protein PR048_000020 [Dryococelus australis]|uniref:Uncharacterized protein n=1 Tax=Dryococelus australis TaxID=614101 RepID=A0ABQ9IFN2_9NEOP|nr:hypothetical protein PR048_000020 [Dryococelus australis]